MNKLSPLLDQSLAFLLKQNVLSKYYQIYNYITSFFSTQFLLKWNILLSNTCTYCPSSLLILSSPLLLSTWLQSLDIHYIIFLISLSSLLQGSRATTVKTPKNVDPLICLSLKYMQSFKSINVFSFRSSIKRLLVHNVIVLINLR